MLLKLIHVEACLISVWCQLTSRSHDPKLKLNMVKGVIVWLLKILGFQPLLLHLFKGEIELYKLHIQYL